MPPHLEKALKAAAVVEHDGPDPVKLAAAVRRLGYPSDLG
jgi:hypothetical protein